MSGWNWRPESGKWRIDVHGWPDTPHEISVSTDTVRAHETYQFWRSFAFPDFEPDPLPPDGEERFSAAAKAFVWDRGDFYEARSSALSGGRHRRHIERDGLDNISVGLVVRGRRDAVHDGDMPISSRAGSMFVYDASHPSKVAWSDHRVLYLSIKRDLARAVLGARLDVPSVMARRLALSPLRPVLRDQLMSIARHGGSVSQQGRSFLLDQAVQLALFALNGSDSATADTTPEHTLLGAAISYIDSHFAEPELGADQMARALGCSRATLYRLFASKGYGVAEYIRDVRLERARQMIEKADAGASISEIAASCGLYDAANFSRQFRRRFDASPTELRGLQRLKSD